MRRLFVLTTLLFALPAHAVTIDWVEVGDPGNDCDVQSQGCFGSVAYTYLISKYETTNAQYAEFLNAVAATDTNGLYQTSMGSGYGGITQDCSSGPCTYSTIAARANMPVNHVSLYDALRFANWLHNGQPTGVQDASTTEDGAYTFSDATSVGSRNTGATIFLPSEDEWYKAAYFDGTSYFEYPTGTDTEIVCTFPGATANTANCVDIYNYSYVGDLTDVGAYSLSGSPYGTFDQAGNVYEWTETIDFLRIVRGGNFGEPWLHMGASNRQVGPSGTEGDGLGFRAAMIPEPSTALLLATGLAGLAATRRRRS